MHVNVECHEVEVKSTYSKLFFIDDYDFYLFYFTILLLMHLCGNCSFKFHAVTVLEQHSFKCIIDLILFKAGKYEVNISVTTKNTYICIL